MSEKQRQTDVGLRALSAAAPFSARLCPHLTYDYSERQVRRGFTKSNMCLMPLFSRRS